MNVLFYEIICFKKGRKNIPYVSEYLYVMFLLKVKYNKISKII